jgi:cytochrome c oxidase subunit 2
MVGLCRLLLPSLLLTVCISCAPRESENSIDQGQTSQGQLFNSEQGKQLFNTCTACHGENGQGNSTLKAPAIGNLDSWYVYRQLMNFKNGIRGNTPGDTLGNQMAAIANTLKDSIAIGHLAAYIETLPEVQATLTLTGDIKKGERTYQSICGSCHGPHGKGNKAMNAPRLNGLDDWYLKSQVLKFKNSIRGSHPLDAFGAQMVPMAALLTSEDAINDVIAYICSTQPVAK